MVLESAYCIWTTSLVLMFLLNFGFFLYQKAVVTTVANQVTEEVSQIYILRNAGEWSSVTVPDVSGIGKYRYLLLGRGSE